MRGHLYLYFYASITAPTSFRMFLKLCNYYLLHIQEEAQHLLPVRNVGITCVILLRCLTARFTCRHQGLWVRP